MAIRPKDIKKINNTRLYHVTGKWTENGKVYRQDFMVAAQDEQDALQIGKNHIPLKITQSGSNLEMQVRDYGIPQPNRTYYSSPILPNTYKPVMPGPVDRMPIAENSIEEINIKSPHVIVKKIPPITKASEKTEDPTPVQEPEKQEPKTTNQTSQEEYYWASYFSILWGTELGKVLHYGKKITKQEHDILWTLQKMSNSHLLLKQWGADYMEHAKTAEKESDKDPIQFFKTKLANFIDQQISLSKGEENHEKK